MRHGRSNAWYALAVAFFWTLPLPAQLEIGDNTSMTMSSNLSFGYEGAFQQTGVSSHGISAGGDAFLHGFYYNPKFLSFDFHPFYNRSQSNSDYQSISNSSGFTGNVGLFSGSRFPGSIIFSKNYNSSGTFGMPGFPALTTHGNGQTFAVDWSELLPNMPTLNATYTMTSNASTIYGESAQSESASKMLNLQSNYKLDGFGLRGFFQHQNSHGDFPSFMAGVHPTELSTSSTSYGFSADHRIPLSGQAYGGWRHTDSGYDFGSGHTDASANTANLNAVLHPLDKLSLAGSINYTSNLSASLEQEIVNAGGQPPPALSAFHSSSTQYNASAGYTVLKDLYATGQVTHLSQMVGGKEYSNTLYGGTVSYNKVQQFLGNFTFVVGVFDNSNQDGHIGTSLLTNLSYSRIIDGWDVGAHFSYTQRLQTLVAVYTTSAYGYGGSVRRRLRYRTYWNASYTAAHSGLNEFAGFSNQSESFNTSISHNGYAISASYAQSSGVSLLTVGGLVQPPVPGPVVGNQVFFNGKGWSFGASGSPLRKMLLTGSFSRSLSDTLSPTNSTRSFSNVLNAQLRYPVRKLYFTAGYTRFRQGLGTAGTEPTDVNTYYFGLSRWFNIF